ncbi:MAG: hypothetical protein ACXWNH_19420 [Vulcanimicrobiaceae bacterium]
MSTRSGTDDRFAKEVDAADDEPEHAGRGERILRDLLHIERRLLRRCVPAAPLMEDDSAGPREGTLVRRADIERELGRHAEVLTLPSGTYPLVGLEMFKECSARYAELASEMFALSGELKDYKAIPQLAANLLKAERGRGAASFYILRNIRGTTRDGKSKSTAFYATVFAPKGVHGKQLIRCQKEKLPVTVLARIVVAEPDGEWKGFTIIEKKQRHWSWAFIVDDVVASTPSTNSD